MSSPGRTPQARSFEARAFHASALPMLITDAGGAILLVNEAFSRVTGYAPDEVQGQNPRILQSGLHDARFYDRMWRVLAREGRWQGEIWNRRKTGELYAEWLALSTVEDERGRVVHYVGVFSDITAHKRAEEHLRELAYFDPLTGLPNRALLLDRCDRAIRSAWRSGACVGLLFIDLDDFKSVNDDWGHDVGDRMLELFGRCVRMILRRSDTVARVGGDEFVALLPEINGPGNAARAAESILCSLDAGFVIQGHDLVVGASIGIASYPTDGADTEALLRIADEAMYEAKRAGKLRYRFHPATRRPRVTGRGSARSSPAGRGSPTPGCRPCGRSGRSVP